MPAGNRRDRTGAGRLTLLLQALLEYGPFTIAAILLVLSTLANEIRDLDNLLPSSRVGLYVCVAFLALFAFTIRLVDRVNHLSDLVRYNSEIQEKFISSSQETTTRLSLVQAFRIAEDVVSHCDRIRIFGLTSKFISQLMQTRFSATEMSLLVAAAGPDCDPLLESEVHLSVLYTWVGRVRSESVGSLNVRQYDFYPTEWYVIFDDRLMITSSYVFDPHEIGNARTTPVAYVVRADDEGAKLIESKTEAFDALFAAAETHFSDGKYEGLYKMVDGRVRKLSPRSDDWEELGPISQSALPAIPRQRDPGASAEAAVDDHSRSA